MNNEPLITETIQSIDFSDEGSWNVQEIKKRLKTILGEEPAIKLHYKKDVMINEASKEAIEIEKLNSIDIIYTDGYGVEQSNIKHLSFNIDL